jgi:hypothetical protein
MFTGVMLALALALGGCTNPDLKKPDGGSGGSNSDAQDKVDTDQDRAPGEGGAGGGVGGQLGTGGNAGTGGVVGTGGESGMGGGTAGSSGTGGVAGDQDGGPDADLDAGSDGPTAVTPGTVGQVVITEIMADTNAVTDDFGEWFEVYNPSAAVTVDLYKCVLFDTANTHTVSRHVVIAPNSFATFARFGDISGGFVPDYDYNPTGCTSTCGTTCPDGCPTVKFSNSGDQVGIKCGATNIDVVDFTTWTTGTPAVVPHGRSYSLDPRHYTASDNDVFANWCLGTMIYNMNSGGTDYGSPGVTNPLCAFD